MKRILAIALALLMMIPATGFAFPDRFDLNVPVGTKEMTIPNDLYFIPHLIDEDGNEIEATWENPDPAALMGSAESGFRAIQPGKDTLIVTPAEGKKQKIKFVVPKVYVSVDEIPSDGKITIKEHKAILLAYQTNYNGITTVGTKGDSVSTTVLHQQDIRPIQYPLYYNMCEDMTVMRLMPQKAGTYKIIINANGKNVKTITVTVKKSALE